MKVSIAYAAEHQSFWQEIEIEEESTALHAIKQSRLEQTIDNLVVESLKIGIFGKVCTKTKTLNEGDRIEVYQPLTAENRQDEDD